MARSLALDFPAAILALALVPFAIFDKAGHRASRHVLWLALVAGIFFLIVPLIVPNDGGKQLGPRYLLALVPILSLIVVGATHARNLRRRPAMALVLIGLTTVLAVGVYRNAYVRSTQLVRDYRGRVDPALRLLRDHPLNVVVVPNQWTAQEFEALFDEKIFFHAPRIEDAVRVAEALSSRGSHRFLAVLLRDDAAPSSFPVPRPTSIERIEFSTLGGYGAYWILEATSIPRGAGRDGVE